MGNAYLCLKCGDYFDTKDELKSHKCARIITRDGEVIRGKPFRNSDPNKEEKRKIGERLKELGVIEKRSEINFTDIDELRKMLKDAEAKERHNANRRKNYKKKKDQDVDTDGVDEDDTGIDDDESTEPSSPEDN